MTGRGLGVLVTLAGLFLFWRAAYTAHRPKARQPRRDAEQEGEKETPWADYATAARSPQRGADAAMACRARGRLPSNNLLGRNQHTPCVTRTGLHGVLRPHTPGILPHSI